MKTRMKTRMETSKEKKEDPEYFLLGTGSGGFLIDLYRQKTDKSNEEKESSEKKTLVLDTKLYQRPTSSSRTIGYVKKQD